MTKEQYFRAMAHMLMAIKALADNYEEGCEYLSMGIIGNHISFNNHPDKEGHYSFFFEAGRDIDNANIRYFDADECIGSFAKEEF